MSHHIHALCALHREGLSAHLVQLAPEDRHLRFGTAIGEAGILSYVDAIDFATSAVFAVFDERVRIAGAVHLAYGKHSAELGLSVLAEARGQGIGNALFARAAVHLSNRYIRCVYMHCLRDNETILHLARKNRMRIVVDGSEADAYLKLPRASPETFASEWMAATLALFDYRLKVSANAAREVLATIADQRANTLKRWALILDSDSP